MVFSAQPPMGGAEYNQSQYSGQTYEEEVFEAEEERRAVGLWHWGGALVSIGLIAGLGLWSYKLTVRDVSGIPVVRALEGPMRVAPDNPGGRVAEHQGLSVTQVASGGGAEPTAEEVALAAEAPVLSADDTPAVLPELGTETVSAEAADAELITPEAETATSLSTDTQTPDPAAVALELAEQLTEGATPLTAAPEPAATPEPVAAPAVQIIPASVPGVKRSPRPPIRPAALRRPTSSIPAPTPAVATTVDGVTDVSATLPGGGIQAGTRLVQLGAFDSESDAATAWAVLSARFDALMEGKTRFVQEATSGGQTFYRLRAVGFADLADARRFCAALVAERADCIPVVAR